MVFEGNISGTVESVVNNIASKAISFVLNNVSGGSNIIALYVKTNAGLSRKLIGITLDDGDQVYSTVPVQVAVGSNIVISSTASLDYYITTEQ